MEFDRALSGYFAEFILSDTFKKKLSALLSEVRYFLKWVIKVRDPTARKI